ncbi:transmembrane protein, putative [Bodo saltans]|uniref:Transmembrane protein, putative n=1 Tax=Bodo saltans TaxID=75058 RepID=A0A0S4J636_BODSA|nr:transmembrane protein, putative [Bodo saltans]|eukprot:CUG86912.1 transmembrane protein, putative [Bodo saltans]
MLFATPPSPVTGTQQDDPELLVTSVGASDATSVLQHVGASVSTNLQQPLQVRRLSSDTDPHIADKSLRQSRTLSNATVTSGSVPGAGVGESAAISVSFHPAGPSFSASNITVTSADNNSAAAVVAANGGAFGENSGGNGGGGETASVVSSTRTSNLSSFGSLSSSQRGFSRGWNPCDRRVSISCLVAALIALTAIVCATAAFVSVFFLFQGHMGTMLHEFTQETVSDISFVVERHFSQYRSMQVLVDKVVHHADIVTTHVNVTAALTWFARDLYNNNMHMLLVRGLYSGYVIGPYSVFDAVDFPKKENQIVVSVITNSTPSAGQFFDIGYFSLDNFSPINLSQPFTRKTNLASFNITNRPYYPSISTKIGWSPAYVTVLTKTSAISIGGPWGADVGAPSDSTYSLHDYTQDVVAYFQTLRISKTGVAMLVDVGTSAFVGGNIADGSVVFNVNGTASLVRLDELQDWRVQPTIAAARPHNNNASAPSVLLTCATPCNLVLCSEGLFPLESRPFTLFSEYTLVSVASITDTLGLNMQKKNGLFPLESRPFTLFSEYTLVSVASITDTLGLNMRLIVILPAGDFVSGVRTSATASMVAAAVVIAIVLLIVFVGVHFATKPLRNAAAFLYNTSRLISTSTKPLHLTLSSLQHRDVARDSRSKRGGDRNSGGDYLEQNSCSFCCCCCCFSRVGTGMSRWIPKFAQIEALNNSVHKLASELRAISAFLPNLPPSGVSRHGSMMTNSTSLEDGTTITPQTDAGDDSNQPDTVSSNGSGTPTPPSAAAAAGGNHHHHQLRHAHNRDVSHLTVQSTTHSNSRDVSVSVFAEAHLSSTQISAGQSVGILEKSRHTTLASTPSTINLYSFGTLWRVPVTTVVCNLIGFDTMRLLLLLEGVITIISCVMRTIETCPT